MVRFPIHDVQGRPMGWVELTETSQKVIEEGCEVLSLLPSFKLGPPPELVGFALFRTPVEEA